MSVALRRIRGAVFARAKGRCEACWGYLVADEGHLDHVFGRARAESVESCWALCVRCDEQKTNNRPTAAYWVRLFIRHARRHGYLVELGRAETRLAVLAAKGFA